MPMNILVVDDSKAMRLIVRRVLRQAGIEHDVVEAENGRLGLSAAAEHKPGLILCDWNMPEMTGIEFLQKLRAQGDKTPFGFVTTEYTTEMRKLAMDSGAAFLIAKPFTPEDFKLHLQSYVH